MNIEIDNNISINILKDERIQLPILCQTDDFVESIEKVLDNYINLLKNYNVSEQLISIVKKYKRRYEQILDEYLLGHHNESYKLFKNIMEDMRINGHLQIIRNPEKYYYRARINENNTDYLNSQMFHIPLNQRGKVTSQRYSFPGLPCLYLSTSTFTCWVELERPQFSKFQVALLQCSNEEGYKVIDLSIHPSYLYKKLLEDPSFCFIPDYLHLWPLIAMCSIKTPNKNDIFKPEYIIPQFVLQYVLENKNEIIGIKYFSIKASDLSNNQYLSNPVTYNNYVFPIKSLSTNKEHLSSDLINRFEIISNYSGKELEVFSDAIKRSGFAWGGNHEEEIIKPSQENTVIYNSNGFPFSYDSSIFRRIENILIKTSETKW